MDDVMQPDHYTHGDIECIDAIHAALGDDGFAAYCTGNIIKYAWRWQHKGGTQDLRKARTYIDFILQATGSGKGDTSNDMGKQKANHRNESPDRMSSLLRWHARG